MKLNELLAILAQSSGEQSLTDRGEEVLDDTFEELGLDSLALLETSTRLEREFQVTLSVEEVMNIKTPRMMLNRVNLTLAAVS
jgi:minimal PKS acyl carrier protein